MQAAVILSLSEGVTLELPAGGPAMARGGGGSVDLGSPGEQVRAALAALASGGASEDALAVLSGAEAPRLFYDLNLLAQRRFLRWSVVCDGRALLSLSPSSPSFVLPSFAIEEGLSYQLSRFAYARSEAGELLLECPLSHAIVTLHDGRAASILFELRRPATVTELAERAAGLDAAAARASAALLLAAGMLEPVKAREENSPPAETALAQWEFHDLLFHARSRQGRHQGRSGGTYRFEGILPDPPVIKPPRSDARLELFRPDIDALRRADIPFTEVLERRRTVYARGGSPITLAALGELLYRSARVCEIRQSPRGAVSLRPYPSGGARHALELYPVVNACDGISPGLYHYRPLDHQLERISSETPETRALLSRAAHGASGGEPVEPQVLLVIAARFPRASYKYEGIAYALLLKEVGALLQTMYLVATAMDLAPCALGIGDADLFARAAGLNYYEETSIGELLISSREGP